jgi:hypothetical protein
MGNTNHSLQVKSHPVSPFRVVQGRDALYYACRNCHVDMLHLLLHLHHFALHSHPHHTAAQGVTAAGVTVDCPEGDVSGEKGEEEEGEEKGRGAGVGAQKGPSEDPKAEEGGEAGKGKFDKRAALHCASRKGHVEVRYR